MADLRIREVRFVAADEAHQRGGLLGWTRFVLGGLALDGVAVRRTREGRLTLSFPSRRGHAIVRPLTDETRREIEREVLEAIGMGERDVG